MPPQLRREEYTVGWVCALPIELAAAKAMLDEEHGNYSRDNDENVYCMGSVAGHNVVLVCLPAGYIGNNPAAVVATQMRTAFKGIRFGLMVGIGGGVPSDTADIRLGDVVVSLPEWTSSGVVQHDLGQVTPTGFKRIGALDSPPRILLSAVSNIQANEKVHKSTLSKHISILEGFSVFSRCRAGPDILFKATYDHTRGQTCDQCSVEGRQSRPQREKGAEVMVHYGTIASGNQVIKNAVERDRISAELGGVLCFEMEAAGLMNSFPCLVVRGICDYADSHKNYQWQAYAAGTAAAYAKDLLSVIQIVDVMEARRAEDVMEGTSKRHRQQSSPDHAPHKRRATGNVSSLDNGSTEPSSLTLPIHHPGQTPTSLDNAQRHILLESLKFEQIDARQMTIKNPYSKTCRWLLKNEQYLNWLDATRRGEHRGVLWIKGKAGTGKSTLMKFADDNARKTMKDHIVLSFFFNARGDDIEKSTVGTYRSLLLRLLERLPALQVIFDLPRLSTSNFNEDRRWNVESLKTLLEQVIRSLGGSSVVCFIDALDECEEEQVRDMIQFFEHIGDLAVSHGINFHVCFSSRHYPHITIRNGLELLLERQEGHTQDITNYVETELKIGKSKNAQRIRAELQEKASGIFMWVVLVVGILNKEFDCGEIHTLRKKLKEIPGDLHELFRDIITRDSQNKDKLVLCIQWVLFAKQPLSPEQLYHAIYAGTDPRAVAKWDSEDITRDVVRRFILNSSKGLAEITETVKPRVQFIHESVRDFLLKDNGLGTIWSEFGSNFLGQSHERLKHCCLNHISVDVTALLEIPDILPKASTQQAKSLRESMTQILPFLDYAVHNVLYHADTAEGGGISQVDLLDSFPLSRWVKLDNLFERHEVRRHTERVSLLYLLAEANAAHLIRLHPFVDSCLDEEDERYGCAFFAAAATGNHEVMKVCIERLETCQSVVDWSGNCPDQSSESTEVKVNLGRDFKYSKKRGMVSHAAEMGNARALACLLQLQNMDLEQKDSKDRTPLYIVAAKGATLMVRMLLDKGADVNAQGGFHGNALQAASYEGHKDIVTLLLDKGANVNAQGGFDGADVNAQGGFYGNALEAASSEGHKDIVTLLLDKGADVNAQGGDDGNALQAASSEGYRDIVTLLLDKGADVNIQGGDDGNALQAASSRGYKDIVTLLLDKGADVNAQGGPYGNALGAASSRGYKDIVTLLLDKGTDVNVQGGHGNALQMASSEGHKDIVTLLLDKGADVNVQGGDDGNALQMASSRGYKDIVTLLLDKGADVNAQGGFYGNALGAASYEGHKDIVTLLLNKDANVNAQGGFYGNALEAASSGGHKDIVTLLLNKGANVNAQGGFYGNALEAASSRSHKGIVTLLLDKGAVVHT